MNSYQLSWIVFKTENVQDVPKKVTHRNQIWGLSFWFWFPWLNFLGHSVKAKMRMRPLDESVESNLDLLSAEVGQSVFPNVKRVDSSLSLLVFCSPYYIIHYFFCNISIIHYYFLFTVILHYFVLTWWLCSLMKSTLELQMPERWFWEIKTLLG